METTVIMTITDKCVEIDKRELRTKLKNTTRTQDGDKDKT